MTLKAFPGAMKLMMPSFRLFFAEDGGQERSEGREVDNLGCTSSELDGVAGCYFDTNTKEQKLHPTAYEPEVQARILAVIAAAAPTPGSV